MDQNYIDLIDFALDGPKEEYEAAMKVSPNFAQRVVAIHNALGYCLGLREKMGEFEARNGENQGDMLSLQYNMEPEDGPQGTVKICIVDLGD